MSIVLSDKSFNDFETLQKIFIKEKNDIYLNCCNHNIESFFLGEYGSKVHQLNNNKLPNVQNVYIFKTDHNTEPINNDILSLLDVTPKEIISSIKSHNIYKTSSVRKSKSTIQSTFNNMNQVRQNTRQINANQAYKKMLNKRKKKKSKKK